MSVVASSAVAAPANAWPSAHSWAALNDSVDGRLHVPNLPFAVCHPNLTVYNKTGCSAIASQYHNSSYISSQPVLLDYNDVGCSPNPYLPCNPDFYPRYFVNASEAQHVKHAVDFARRHSVRLVVKGTGHDWNGRSTAPNSLSIWTHYLRFFEVHDAFRPRSCQSCDAQPAVTIGAGYQMAEIQKLMSEHNRVIVGGADPDVGIGGYLGGGGHSPISRQYGLGADQILEMEVVSADGRILTVNQVRHPHLFWALRGGGASTYAAVISFTVKSFPTPKIASVLFGMNTTANSAEFWDLAAYFHSQLPQISDSGLMGYYYIIPDSPAIPALGFTEPGGFVFGIFIALNTTTDSALSKLHALKHYASAHPGVGFLSTANAYPSYYTWWITNNPAAVVGLSGRLGSRLLSRAALQGSQARLKHALQTASNSAAAPQTLLGHLVAGKGVAHAVPAGGADAVLPAWRAAITHLIVVATWSPLNQTQETQATRLLTYSQVAALRELDPQSGAYVNEADPCEPDWQRTFWGSHYGRLQRIKNDWDPTGVFECFPCVGGDQKSVYCPTK